MRVVTVTRLWPNEAQPAHGIFVEERMRRFAAMDGCTLRVVAPVPWIPRAAGRLPVPDRWREAAAVPSVEWRHGIPVEHPRYPVLPMVGLRLQGRALASTVLRSLRRMPRAAPVDLVDAHFLYPDGYAAVTAASRLGLPVVVSARGSDANVLPDAPGMQKPIARTVVGATALIAVSQPIASRLIALGADPAKVFVVPNGVDTADFHYQALGRASLRAALGIPQNEALLLAVARLEPVKGVDVLVDAMGMLARRPQSAPARLVVIGDGRERAALEARARAAGLRGRISFEGRVDHRKLGAWYSAADLVCLPSHAEGHPNVLVESLACGTPAVASNVGAVPDVLSSAAGIVVPPGDAAALADGIEAALAASREGAFPRETVRAVVAGRSWEAVAAGVREVFDEALRRHRRERAAA